MERVHKESLDNLEITLFQLNSAAPGFLNDHFGYGGSER